MHFVYEKATYLQKKKNIAYHKTHFTDISFGIDHFIQLFIKSVYWKTLLQNLWSLPTLQRTFQDTTTLQFCSIINFLQIALAGQCGTLNFSLNFWRRSHLWGICSWNLKLWNIKSLKKKNVESKAFLKNMKPSINMFLFFNRLHTHTIYTHTHTHTHSIYYNTVKPIVHWWFQIWYANSNLILAQSNWFKSITDTLTKNLRKDYHKSLKTSKQSSSKFQNKVTLTVQPVEH